MDFRLLGPVEVIDDEGNARDLGPRKQRALLCFLLLHADQVVSTDRIVQALWGDDAVDKERALWVVVSRLRSALEPDRPRGHESTLVETREHGYVLSLGGNGHRVDVADFTQAVARARDLLRRDTPDDAHAAAELLDEALDLWRGDPLGEFRGEEFARHDVTRLEDLQLEALELRAEADLRRGKGREQIAELEALHEQNPLQERFVELLMRALYGAGRQAEALRVFTRYRERIGEELGIDPSPELRRLEEQILLHDAAVQRSGAEPAAPTTATNPYKGLRPFREDDAGDFHGRDRLVDELVVALDGDETLVAVVGPSGSGKSSVVRAGLVPALRAGAIDGSENWLIAQMTPGAHPFAELDGALARAGADVRTVGDDLLRTLLTALPDETTTALVVIDQFEELFTVTDDPTRDRFIEAMVAALDDVRGRIRIAVTLRADFYDRPLAYPELGTRLSGNVVNVTPLSNDELHAAAVEPAAAVGVRFEPAALSSLIADLGQQAGALPLFQYALTEMFDRREGDLLTAAAYNEMGGVQGALGRRAEELYRALSADQQSATREVLLRLVVLSESGTRTRRRAAASEITSLDTDVVTLQTVIEQFGRHRLLAFDKDPETGAPTVEVAHEALLVSWSRLAGWVDESIDDLRRLAGLRRLIEDWDTAGENPDYLVAGSRLTELETWSRRTSVPLTVDEQAYLRAAIDRRETDLRLEAERARREARRLRVALVGTGIGLVLALLAGAFAVVQQRRADDRAEEADRAAEVAAEQAALATARATAARANALAGIDRPLALAIAAESHGVDPLPIEAVEALITARQRLVSPEWDSLGAPFHAPLDGISDIAPRAGGPTAFAITGDAGFSIVDADGQGPVPRFEQSGGFGDNAYALDAGAYVLDGWSGEVTTSVERAAGTAIAFADDLVFVASGSRIDSGELQADGRFAVATIRAHETRVTAMELSSDAMLLASGDVGGTTLLWAAETGSRVGEPIVRQGEAVTALAFSPDGSVLAIGGGGTDEGTIADTASLAVDRQIGHDDGFLMVVDLATREVIRESETEGRVLGLAFSSDASMLAAASTAADGSGSVRILDPATGRELVGLERPDLRGARGVAFSPTDGLLVAGGFQEVRSWNPLSGELIDAEILHTNESALPPDWAFVFDSGLLLAAQASDPLVQRWIRGTEDGTAQTIGTSETSLLALRTSPDPERNLVVVAGTDGIVTSLARGGTRDRSDPIVAGSGILSLGISPDGSLVFAGDSSGGIWSASSSAEDAGTQIAQVGAPVRGLVVGHDGIVYAGTESEIQILDASAGAPTRPPLLLPDRIQPADTITAIAVSPDGTTIAATSISGAVFGAQLDDGSDELSVIGEHDGAASAVAFSPDGTMLASAGSGDVHFRDSSTWERLPIRLVHDVGIASLAFSPDGRLLVVGDDRGAVSFWRVDTGRRIGEPFAEHDAAVTGVAFSSDGSRVYSASRDGTLLEWDVLDPARACELAAPFVTHERLDAELGPDLAPSVCNLSDESDSGA